MASYLVWEIVYRQGSGGHRVAGQQDGMCKEVKMSSPGSKREPEIRAEALEDLGIQGTGEDMTRGKHMLYIYMILSQMPGY